MSVIFGMFLEIVGLEVIVSENLLGVLENWVFYEDFER